jgi:hypothetical protein
MNKFFLFVAILASNKCYSATGNASDGELALLSVIVILMLPIAAVYFINYLKSRINNSRTRKVLKKNMIEHNGEIGN